MSRLEKQIASASGEKAVRIEWPNDDVVDTGAIRKMLKKEIDSHERLIPLDLRGVRGAPDRLVEILVDMRCYAVSVNKSLSMPWILPELRIAIDERLSRPVGSSAQPSCKNVQENASERAEEILRDAGKKGDSPYDMAHAKKIDRPEKKRVAKPLTKRKRYMQLGFVVFIGTALVICAGASLLFQIEDQTVIIEVPRKGFE
ncbi:MAG: hypothetical protein AAF802_12750 [Planctomycetota bacterium]